MTNRIEILLPYILIISAVAVSVVGLFCKPHRKRGSADKKLTLVLPIAKTVYTVIGHFSKTSKMTAKDKVERLIKKEIQK